MFALQLHIFCFHNDETMEQAAGNFRIIYCISLLRCLKYLDMSAISANLSCVRYHVLQYTTEMMFETLCLQQQNCFFIRSRPICVYLSHHGFSHPHHLAGWKALFRDLLIFLFSPHIAKYSCDLLWRIMCKITYKAAPRDIQYMQSHKQIKIGKNLATTHTCFNTRCFTICMAGLANVSNHDLSSAARCFNKSLLWMENWFMSKGVHTLCCLYIIKQNETCKKFEKSKNFTGALCWWPLRKLVLHNDGYYTGNNVCCFLWSSDVMFDLQNMFELRQYKQKSNHFYGENAKTLMSCCIVFESFFL